MIIRPFIFIAPYPDAASDARRSELRRIRMRAILDAGDYAIETNRSQFIAFLHEFLDRDHEAFVGALESTGADSPTTKEPAVSNIDPNDKDPIPMPPPAPTPEPVPAEPVYDDEDIDDDEESEDVDEDDDEDAA